MIGLRVFKQINALKIVVEVGLVTGRTVEPDLLDRVFSNFCIGK